MGGSRINNNNHSETTTSYGVMCKDKSDKGLAALEMDRIFYLTGRLSSECDFTFVLYFRTQYCDTDNL